MINLYNEEQYGAVIKRAVNGVFEHFNIASDDAEVEIELISEEEIRELNREEREIDAVTDVLSFPTLNVKLPFNYDDYPIDVNPESGAIMLGELYVCLKRAEEQAVFIDFDGHKDDDIICNLLKDLETKCRQCCSKQTSPEQIENVSQRKLSFAVFVLYTPQQVLTKLQHGAMILAVV